MSSQSSKLTLRKNYESTHNLYGWEYDDGRYERLTSYGALQKRKWQRRYLNKVTESVTNLKYSNSITI